MTETNAVLIQEGAKLVVNGVEVQVGHLLGEGLTSFVFHGQMDGRDAAIKVLKPGNSQTIKNYFLGEEGTISEIAKGWQDLWPQDPQVVPEILGYSKLGEQPYLIMEFIHGQEVPEVLKEKGHLSEGDALGLATQFGKLLCVLHERLQRCYADIKLENLWLMNNRLQGNHPLLKVTDWNVLGEYEPDAINRDLFFASLYVYRMLTGVALPFSGTQVRGKVDQDEAFHHLSKGTQHFLRSALHASQERRYPDARKWMNAVENLARWWFKQTDELNIEAAETLELARDQKDKKQMDVSAETYRRAQSILDISDRLGRGDREVWAELSNQVNEGLDSTNSLEIGKRHLMGGAFEKAEEAFLRGADLSPLDSERLYRWYWLATACKQIGLESFNNCSKELMEGTEALTQGDSRKAILILKQAASKLSSVPEGLSALVNESHILNLVDDAHQAQLQEDYHQAVLNFEKAFKLQKELPLKPQTNWAETAGNLEEFYLAAQKEEASLGRAKLERQAASSSFQEENWQEVVAHLKTAWLRAPDDRKTIKLWSDLANEQLKKGNLEAAIELLEPAFSVSGNVKELKSLCQRAMRLQSISNFIEKKDLQGAFEHAKSYKEQFFGKDEFYLEAFLKQMDTILAFAASDSQFDVLEKLYAMMWGVDENWAENAKLKTRKAIDSLKDSRIQRLKNEIMGLLDQQKFDEASSKIDELLKVMPQDDSQWQKYEQTKAELIEQGQQKRKEYNQRLMDIKNEIAAIRNEINERIALIKQIRSSQQLKNKQIYTEDDHICAHYSLVNNGLALSNEWLQLVKNDDLEASQEKKWFLEQIQKGKQIAWQSLYRESKQKLEYLTRSFENAQQAYEAGKPETCLDILKQESFDLVDDKNYQLLNANAKIAEEFLRWVSNLENPDYQKTPSSTQINEISQLKQWIDQNLPIPYWKQSVKTYFVSKLEQKIAGFQKASASNYASFVNAVAELIQYTWAEQDIDVAMGNASSDTSVSLQQVVKEAWKINSNRRGKLPIKSLLTLIRGVKHQNNSQKLTTEIKQILQAQEKKHKREQIAGIFVGILAIAILSIFIVGFIKDWLSPSSSAQTTETALFSEPNIVITDTLLSPTATVIPTELPTVTPTVVPTSQYLKSWNDLQSAWPKVDLPEGIQDQSLVYILDDQNADFINPDSESSEWITVEENAYAGSMHYINSPSEVDVAWRMDQPLENGGWYEVFASDTLHNSQSGEINCVYEVRSNGEILEPLLGQNVIKQIAESDSTPGNNGWRSLGIYDFSQGSMIEIQLKVNAVDVNQDNSQIVLGVDAVMISPVSQRPDENKTQHDILFLADDTIAKFNPGKENWDCKTQSSVENPSTWGGDCALNLAEYFANTANIEDAITVEWPLYPLLGPGKFDIYVWIPENNNAEKADELFSVLKNGSPVESVPIINLTSSMDLSGVEYLLGSVELKENDRAVYVVQMKSMGKSGWVAVDTVYVTRSIEGQSLFDANGKAIDASTQLGSTIGEGMELIDPEAATQIPEP